MKALTAGASVGSVTNNSTSKVNPVTNNSTSKTGDIQAAGATSKTPIVINEEGAGAKQMGKPGIRKGNRKMSEDDLDGMREMLLQSMIKRSRDQENVSIFIIITMSQVMTDTVTG